MLLLRDNERCSARAIKMWNVKPPYTYRVPLLLHDNRNLEHLKQMSKYRLGNCRSLVQEPCLIFFNFSTHSGCDPELIGKLLLCAESNSSHFKTFHVHRQIQLVNPGHSHQPSGGCRPMKGCCPRLCKEDWWLSQLPMHCREGGCSGHLLCQACSITKFIDWPLKWDYSCQYAEHRVSSCIIIID